MINLKTNKNIREILEYKKKLKDLYAEKIELVVFPSSPFLGFFYDVPYKVGSQSVSIYESGSHTGEILAKDIASLKVSYCLINHAEAPDTTENIKQKIKNATKENIKVVLCIGEKEEKTETEINRELTNFLEEVLKDLTKQEQENILLAYEPTYRIGTHQTIKEEKLTKICQNTKEYIKNNFHIEISFLYGGGITPENCNKLTKIDKLDGFLIGNSANNPENIRQIFVNL